MFDAGMHRKIRESRGNCGAVSVVLSGKEGALASTARTGHRPDVRATETGPGKWVYRPGLGATIETRAAPEDRWHPRVAVNAPRPWNLNLLHQAWLSSFSNAWKPPCDASKLLLIPDTCRGGEQSG